MDLWSSIVAGVVLALLWCLEGSMLAFTTFDGSIRQRFRHVVLGLMNLIVSSGVAGVLLTADMVAENHTFGVMRELVLPWWLKFVAAFLLLDGWQYVMHVIAHHVPVLWRVHAVHHTAEHLEATVSMRFHLVEVAWMGLATVPFVVLLGISIEHVAIYNTILVIASMFHHANIRLGSRLDKALRTCIVTPNMHRVHHSRWTSETNSNYGAVLPIWDWLFGTIRMHEKPELIRVGLDGYTEREMNSVAGMIATPFGPSRSGYGEAASETSHNTGDSLQQTSPS